MATDYGHVKISRKAYAEDQFWTEARQFSKWEAWEWMIQAAAWKDHRRVVGMTVVEIKRGEFLASVRYLAEAWGWRRSRVHEFLKLLMELERISGQRDTPAGTVYLLVKYDDYQSTPDDDRTPERTEAGQEPDSERTASGQRRSSKAVLSNELPNARETSEVIEAAKAEMRTDANQHALTIPTGPARTAFNGEVRGIVSGDNLQAWRIQATGDLVPWEDRPRLLRLALDGLAKAKSLYWAVVYASNQQYDPLVPRTAEEITHQRGRRDESQASPAPPPAPSAEEREAAGAAEEEARTTRRAAEDERISAWAAANELEAARLRKEIRDQVQLPPSMEHLTTRTVEETYRSRVLALLEGQIHAA